jgi:hypothetical protein
LHAIEAAERSPHLGAEKYAFHGTDPVEPIFAQCVRIYAPNSSIATLHDDFTTILGLDQALSRDQCFALRPVNARRS